MNLLASTSTPLLLWDQKMIRSLTGVCSTNVTMIGQYSTSCCKCYRSGQPWHCSYHCILCELIDVTICCSFTINSYTTREKQENWEKRENKRTERTGEQRGQENWEKRGDKKSERDRRTARESWEDKRTERTERTERTKKKTENWEDKRTERTGELRGQENS